MGLPHMYVHPCPCQLTNELLDPPFVSMVRKEKLVIMVMATNYCK